MTTERLITAFFDASCPNCQTRIGWYGTLAERPACPYCSYRPDGILPASPEMLKTRQLQARHVCRHLRKHCQQLLGGLEYEFISKMDRRYSRHGELDPTQMHNIHRLARKYAIPVPPLPHGAQS